MPARSAYRFIKDELDLNGRPSLNLASFVTYAAKYSGWKKLLSLESSTYMEPEAEQVCVQLWFCSLAHI